MNPKVICTFNNQEIFDKVVKNNEYVKDAELLAFNNIEENVEITKRYNTVLAEIANSKESEDCWCVFIHQDFGFMEDLNSILSKLDKNCINGAIGVKIFKGIFFGKNYKSKKWGFKTELKLTYGMILQGDNGFNFKPHGRKLYFPMKANTTDCCCIILHSSLIKKYNLRFDENLSFHMYAEELCYRAKKDYGVCTKITQMNCYHLGVGSLNQEFDDSVNYLKNKFGLKRIPSTCPN